jgi:hypothetical protein
LNPSSEGSSGSCSSLEQCQETARGGNGWCSHVVDFGATRANDSLAYSPAQNNKRSSGARHVEEKIRKDDVPVKGVGAESKRNFQTGRATARPKYRTMPGYAWQWPSCGGATEA